MDTGNQCACCPLVLQVLGTGELWIDARVMESSVLSGGARLHAVRYVVIGEHLLLHVILRIDDQIELLKRLLLQDCQVDWWQSFPLEGELRLAHLAYLALIVIIFGVEVLYSFFDELVSSVSLHARLLPDMFLQGISVGAKLVLL